MDITTVIVAIARMKVAVAANRRGDGRGVRELGFAWS
jgi:hypothetical protein